MHTHHSSDSGQVGEEVTIFHKLGHQTHWLLQRHTPNHVHHMRVVALGNLLHRIYLGEEVAPLATCCRFWRST